MTEKRIKMVIRKYRIRGALMLAAFLFIFIAFDYYLVKNAIDIGLKVSPRHGYTWGAIIIGLNIVFLLGCYLVEKVLIELFSNNTSISNDHS